MSKNVSGCRDKTKREENIWKKNGWNIISKFDKTKPHKSKGPNDPPQNKLRQGTV